MNSANDLAILRRRIDDLERAIDGQRGSTSTCTVTQVVQTFTEDVYPTSAGAVFACHPVQLSGTEEEGAAVTVTPDTTQTLYVSNTGSQIPPDGTNIEATQTGGRWSTRYDG